MITKAGLAVLDALRSGREATTDELAAVTGYSRAHLYEVMDQFVAEGLLTETRGRNNLRRVQVTDHPVVEAYRNLVSSLGHVEWAEFLSPALLQVCWYLDEPNRASKIADRLEFSRQRAYEALSPFKNRAMLSLAGPEYALDEDFAPLLEFAHAVGIHEHRTRVREIAPSATVEWCDPKRALVRVQTAEDTTALQSADDWQITGLARFQRYGLQFFLASEPAFWYAPSADLSPAEVVCHTLVLDSELRRVSYSMLLIETEGIEEEVLTETAKWYDLEREASELYRPLQGEFDASDDVSFHLPSESEYEALKEQYGLK